MRSAPDVSQWVIDNFLPESQFNEMRETFPEITSEAVRADNDLYCGDREYSKHISRNRSWLRFHEKVFSRAFWAPFMPNISLFEFNNSYLEPRSGVAEHGLPRFLYSRIDIGIAGPGYGINNGGRGLHIDNRQRIISGLLYFTSQSEIEGGEFCFCSPDGRIKEKHSLRLNRAIISHQDNIGGWHMVNPLRKGKRRFIYFSLNSTWDYYERG